MTRQVGLRQLTNARSLWHEALKTRWGHTDLIIGPSAMGMVAAATSLTSGHSTAAALLAGAITAPVVLAILLAAAGIAELAGLLARGVSIIRAAVEDKSLSRIVTGLSAGFLVGLASLLAGHRRLASSTEWRAHLGGNSGHDPLSWLKVGEALGFVAAAIRFRLADAADVSWIPVDAIRRSRMHSNLLVFGISAIATVDVGQHEGRLGVIVSAESLTGIGGVVYGLVRVGRWYRDVKPPEPKARRTKRDEPD